MLLMDMCTTITIIVEETMVQAHRSQDISDFTFSKSLHCMLVVKTNRWSQPGRYMIHSLFSPLIRRQ